MLSCPFCASADVMTHVAHNNITYVLCDGCGAVVSFRARAQPDETVRLYRSRLDARIKPGYTEALERLKN